MSKGLVERLAAKRATFVNSLPSSGYIWSWQAEAEWYALAIAEELEATQRTLLRRAFPNVGLLSAVAYLRREATDTREERP